MSVFADKLSEGGFPASLEITPPQKPLAEVLLRRARLLGSAVDAVNVVQRTGRVSSLEASGDLRRAGIEPVWHLVNRGRRRDSIASDIALAREMGIRVIVCLRGDHMASEVDESPKVREVVAMVREAIPEALIGTTMNQYGPRDRVLANLMPKLEAGADFVQTQPVFDGGLFASLADEVLSRSPSTAIMPMAMPVLSIDDARRLEARLGVAFPSQQLARLQESGEAAGWEIFGETLADLYGRGLAHAVAVMTLMADPPEPVAARIASLLRRHT
jgi:methylenetetrahydrofolate reductase (NADPH)